MKVLSASPAFIIVLALLSAARADHHEAPEGFAPLFNSKDLTGWHGLGHFDPRELKSMPDKQRTEKRAKDDANLAKHWKVADGEIVNDGHGVFLTTDKDYGDFEFLVDWRMVEPNGDSGIYLRGCPQVQIWDPSNKKEVKNGADKGSGALWNNNPDSAGRFPLVKADKPIGEWNTLRVKMVGDRVTVHLNGQLTVDNAVMHNYFDRAGPMFETGPIQLQTHGSEMRFRNIFVREIPREKKSSP